MRILVISHLYPFVTNKTYGIFTARQFEMAAKLGADITIIFPIVWIPVVLQKFNSKWRDYNKVHAPVYFKDVKVITVPYFRVNRSFSSCRWDGFFISKSARRKILQLHCDNPFDIVYGKGIFPSADVAVRISRLLKIPAVGEGIGSDVDVVPDYSRVMYRHFLRVTGGLDGAVADGAGVARRLSGVMKKDIPTIHGLVDLDEFSPSINKGELRESMGISTSSLIILFAGNLKKEKGVYELLESFKSLKRCMLDLKLQICGSGVEKAGIEKEILDMKLVDNVTLLGNIEPSEMNKWMKASDIFVLPTYHEGMPNVVMEAMACGLPVVSTRVGGIPDAVGDSEGAILVEPENVNELTEAMKKVLVDKGLREKMCKAARQTAVRKFGAEQNCRKLLEYLEKIIES